MTATVTVIQATSSGPTTTTITNLRMNTDDTANPGTTNPLVKPAAGTNRSFWKTVYLNCTVTPDNAINNCKIYSDAAIGWTGVTLFGGATGTYTEATGTIGTTGTDSSIATTNVAGWTSGAAKTLTGSLSNPSTGRITDYVIFQADVSTSAVAGNLAAETMTFQYDET